MALILLMLVVLGIVLLASRVVDQADEPGDSLELQRLLAEQALRDQRRRTIVALLAAERRAASDVIDGHATELE